MRDVVDSADDHAAAAPFEHCDRGVLDSKWEQTATRFADDAMQRHLNHAAMRDDEHVAARMLCQDLIDRLADPGIEFHLALSARHDVPVRLLDPPRPCFGITRSDLVRAQALPLAEVDLAKRRLGDRAHADRSSDDLGRLERAFEIAREVGGEGPPRQTGGQELGLAAAVLGEGWIELALDAVLAVPGRLPVADQNEPRRSRPIR